MLGSYIGTLLDLANDNPTKLNFMGYIALGYPFEGYGEERTSGHLDELNDPFLYVCG
jgi:hypothetical protein